MIMLLRVFELYAVIFMSISFVATVDTVKLLRNFGYFDMIFYDSVFTTSCFSFIVHWKCIVTIG
jgi:hypothetical protein